MRDSGFPNINSGGALANNRKIWRENVALCYDTTAATHTQRFDAITAIRVGDIQGIRRSRVGLNVDITAHVVCTARLVDDADAGPAMTADMAAHVVPSARLVDDADVVAVSNSIRAAVLVPKVDLRTPMICRSNTHGVIGWYGRKDQF